MSKYKIRNYSKKKDPENRYQFVNEDQGNRQL